MWTALRVLFFLFLVSNPIIAFAVPTVPTAVTLYPTGGWIQVVEMLPVQNGKIYFELPAGTQVGSLLLNVEGYFVGSIETKPIGSIDSPLVAKIRERYTKAAQEVAYTQGKLAAIKAKIALWSNSKCMNNSIDEIKKFDAMMATKLEELYVAEATIEPDLKKALYQLELLEKAIIDAGGQNTYATAVTAVIQSESKTSNSDINKKVKVQYGYMLSGCGWNPVYRLNALPNKNLVYVIQEAELRQASGQDWKGVDIMLASANIGSALMPPVLPEWQIRPAPTQTFHQPSPMSADATSPMMLARTSIPVVHAQEEPTFTTWSLGKVDVPAGMVMRFVLYKRDWKADFFRLLRPSLQTHAYLGAKVDVTEPIELLSGSAQFMVDGKIVGTGYFSLMNEEENIYFGVDPRVTAQMVLDKSQSGRNGFLDKKQSHNWSWNIKVYNEHTTPVKIILEEPQPQSGDTGIIITTESVPSPTVENHMYVWKLTIPAEGKKDIHHTVSMTAPSDMKVIEGR